MLNVQNEKVKNTKLRKKYTWHVHVWHRTIFKLKVLEYKSYTNTIKKSQNTSVRIKQTENYRKKLKYTIQVIGTNRKSLEKAESGEKYK